MMKKKGDHGTRCNMAHVASMNKTPTSVKAKDGKSTKGIGKWFKKEKTQRNMKQASQARQTHTATTMEKLQKLKDEKKKPSRLTNMTREDQRKDCRNRAHLQILTTMESRTKILQVTSLTKGIHPHG